MIRSAPLPAVASLVVALCLSACGPKRGPAASGGTDAPAFPAHAASLGALEDAAADLDPAVRARALSALIAASPEPGGGPWGRRGTFDPSPWVQRAALDALAARRDDPVARLHLRETVARGDLGPYVRCGAALRLAPDAQEPLLDTILAIEADAGAAWRAAPCALAAAAHGDPDAEQRLAGMLEEGELPLDLGFVADVGASARPGLIPALEEAAALAEEALQPALAAALLSLGADAGADRLREALSAPAAQDRLEALDFLAQVDSPRSTDLLRKAASGAEGPDRVYARLLLLGRGEAGLDAAEDAAASDNRELRALAMRHLGEAVRRARQDEADRRLERSALKLLQAGASDLDDPVREEAAAALGALPGPAVRDDLEALLADDNARVRVAAAASLLTAPAR